MTVVAWGQLALFSVLVLLTTKPLGHLHGPGVREATAGRCRDFSGRWSGSSSGSPAWTRPPSRPGWATPARCSVFSAIGVLVTYAILRLQHLLPLNPQKLGAVDPALAFNTAASFTTNTNWQAYTGESTMSYLTQMAGLAWHNFTSAAAGIGVALALARGLDPPAGARGAEDPGQLLGRPDPGHRLRAAPAEPRSSRWSWSARA